MKSMTHLTKRFATLFRKHRFSMINVADGSEAWHMHSSPAGLLAALTAFTLLLFILILMLVAYTPVLEFLPGYRTQANRTRDNVMQNLIRLDSMERMMNDMLTYNTNIALIMEGKTPVIRTVEGADSTHRDKTLVMPSHEDSLLRAQMENPGEYNIGQSGTTRRAVRESLEMSAPVEGIVTDRFDIKEGRYGISIAAATDAQVAAIDKGMVVMSLWAPDTGYMIGIQHEGNLLSLYKNISKSLVVKGQTVKRGEVIGYNAEAVNDGHEVRLFELEMWDNGKPVDPEGYIVF